MIALQHGATIDKFIGDAMLLFFGDPQSKGVAEDAKACVVMAIAMQRRMRDLEQEWRNRGLLRPFRIRYQEEKARKQREERGLGRRVPRALELGNSTVGAFLCALSPMRRCPLRVKSGRFAELG